jgi:hypothetical protein
VARVTLAVIHQIEYKGLARTPLLTRVKCKIDLFGGIMRWSRLSEQIFRFDKWSLRRD